MAGTDFDLVFTDLDFGEDKTGIDVLKEVKKNRPNLSGNHKHWEYRLYDSI